MADFEAPSFSLGLDCGLLDSESQICTVIQDVDPSSSNQFSGAAAVPEDEHYEFETLVVDDSEPEDPDPHPKLKRLRRGPTMDAAPSSSSAKVELHSRVGVDDEHLSTQHRACSSSSMLPLDKHGVLTDRSGMRKQNVSNAPESVITSCNNRVSSKLTVSPLRRFHRYFFHEDQRIQELVRTRLPNFSPLGDTINRDFEQPSTSNIDYMGQFSLVQSSKQAVRNHKDSTSKKISRKSRTEEASPGWINPKLGVDKGIPKNGAKRRVHVVGQAAGHWFTGADGKKVYVRKGGQELTGRVAYIQYSKERGAGFRKAKRKSAKKKK